MGVSEPSTEDGLIEVVGLTTYQLVSDYNLQISFKLIQYNFYLFPSLSYKQVVMEHA